MNDPLAAWQPPGETTISGSGSGNVDSSPTGESPGEAILEEARDVAVSGDDELGLDLTEADEAGGSTKDVPTWEDALSQLPRNSGGGSGNSGKSGSGGRKRRRRRRGRGGQGGGNANSDSGGTAGSGTSGGGGGE
ncbi:MAG: hypothetical protein CMJ69_21545 [Planctomycetaceae bacterium]|nr:hypothetical protein [Planctomycetaceae bacterium]